MKHSKLHALSLSALFVTLFAWTAAYSQVTPSGDSYINTADPTTNYGSKTLLDVDGATQTTYIQFNLGSIPAGASVSQATLKLYVNSVTSAGSFNVDYVSGAWSEGTIDASNAPALGSPIASGIAITTADKNQYILINLTSAVQAWLSGSEANNGIALVANSSFNATFDSKENTTTSHPAELDIAYAGGDGTITGITTASGSGLTGGGTSGTLNLALTNACAANQVLQWNGSAWICASVGTGTITGVTAGTGLSGGGTSGTVTLNNAGVLGVNAGGGIVIGGTSQNPTVINIGVLGVDGGSGIAINGTGSIPVVTNTGILGLAQSPGILIGGGQTPTIGIDPTVVPELATANTFTGNQTVNGNLSATGVVTGSGFQIGSNLFAFGSYANRNAFLGFSGNTTETGTNNTVVGYAALSSNTSGFDNTASGINALQLSTTGSGNTAVGAGALGSNTQGSTNTAAGEDALYNNTTGNWNTALGTSAGEMSSGSPFTGSYNTAVGGAAVFSSTNLEFATVIGYQAVAGQNNSTAVGSFSEVDGANALVLGSINGVNGATASVNVGIGTTTPAAPLDVASQNLHTYIGGACSQSGYGGITFGTSGFNGCTNYSLLGNGLNTYINAPGGDIFFRINNGLGPSAMTIVSSGLVGISDDSPSNLLTLKKGGGAALADGWSTYSSRRWKTNIQTLHGALEKIEQLRGVTYDLKASGKHEVGLIAEEVGAVVPEIVSWEENGKDAQGVDYSRLTALLIEATKEQQTLIRQQQELIQTQQAEIKQLTRQVRTVQAVLKGSGPGLREARTVKANVAKE